MAPAGTRPAPGRSMRNIYWLSVGGVLIEWIEPSAVFVYYRGELKTLVVASKKLVVPVSGGGFQGGGAYTAVALRQNSRENQHLVSGIGLERKQSGL